MAWILGAQRRPAKIKAELSIDAYAVLAGSIALEWFKSVSHGYPQVAYLSRDLQLPQFSTGNSLDVHKAPYLPALG